ncbi:MAG: peptidase T, partial [Rhodobacteraceae bacterium]|nr:peptidase T [Paracoccaceae bacterium]
MTQFHDELAARLMRYAAIDSQSDEDSASAPSTPIQWNMARLLAAELADIGAVDVQVTEYGAVLATIPGTAAGPVIGFLAHM